MSEGGGGTLAPRVPCILVTALAYSSCRRSGVRALPPLRILYSFQLNLQYSNFLSSYGHPLSVHCYSSFTLSLSIVSSLSTYL